MIEVGKRLILENLSDRRGGTRYRWVVVEKVGNKFFYVSSLPRERFFLETLKMDARNFVGYRLHLSLHKLTAELLAQNTYQYLTRFFADQKNQQKQYDPGQLVEVCKILGVETVVIDDIRDKVEKRLDSLYHNVDTLTGNEIETIQKHDIDLILYQKQKQC